MTKATVELIEYKKNRDTAHKSWVYELAHSNGRKTLRQDVEFNQDEFGRVSVILNLDELPTIYTKEGAAEKLADWLQRLSWAIKAGVKRGDFE